jgi:hypothetical protein
VFLKPAGGWQATGSQNVELQASDARDAGALGVSVAIAGNTIVAGASGLADYVFVMPAGGWTSVATETAKITSSPPAVSGFGFAVAADGDTVISSDSNRDATYVFTRPAPSATIDAPSDGAKFTQHQSITAAYSCSDQPDGSGLASCTGTVPNGALIDTETVGTHSFAVTATDRAGASRTQTVSYSVVPRAQIEIATPARAETFALGARVLADYTCQFATACAGTVANGSPIDTSTSGTHTFEVTAVDTAGTTSTRTVDYAVAPGAPRLTNVRQSHHRWRRGRASARIAPGHGHVPTGTTFSFVIDQPATVTFNFARLRHDHARTAGRLRLRAHTGTNRVRFTGMLSRERTLSPGRYRLTITATTAEGERSAAHRLRFSIVR